MTTYQRRKRLRWLRERKQGVGASEAGIVLGHCPWKTRLELYLDKVSAEIGDPQNERLEAGLYLEPAIAKWVSDKTGWRTTGKGDKIYWSRESEFALATPDRFLHSPEHGTGVLEIKTTSDNVRSWAAGSIPQHYYTQLQWQMYCTGCAWGVLAWLAHGREFGWLPFGRDNVYIAWAVEEVGRFWYDHVLAGVPPAPLDPRETRLVAARPEKDRRLRHRDWLLVENLRALKTERKALDERIKESGDRVRMLFDDAEYLSYGGRRVASYKANRRGERIFRLL